MNDHSLIFLKLGGSLITDKNQPLTARPQIISRIAKEIKEFLEENPEVQLLIGHGSGSFGHAVAEKYQTQEGVKTPYYWQGFSEVWNAARKLNQYVVDIFHQAGLPIIAFPPSAGVMANNKTITSWDINPMKSALGHKLIPIVQGDVIFDSNIGGTIFSTERIFQFLSEKLNPTRILLAGLDKGVYTDPSAKDDIIHLITPANYKEFQSSLSGAKTVDVTGGMLSKVQLMLDLVKSQPLLQVQIFSGLESGNINKAFAGETLGTLIKAFDGQS